MSLFAAHLTDKEIAALRGVVTEVGVGCPRPWGREVEFGARGWPVSPRSGETSMLGRLWRPRPELGAGHPSRLPSLAPALSSASHHDVSMSRARVCSQPPPHVSVFVTSSVLAAPEGGAGGGNPFYFRSGKAVFGSSTWCQQPGA